LQSGTRPSASSSRHWSAADAVVGGALFTLAVGVPTAIAGARL
jgi:hypothetical protein